MDVTRNISPVGTEEPGHSILLDADITVLLKIVHGAAHRMSNRPHCQIVLTRRISQAARY